MVNVKPVEEITIKIAMSLVINWTQSTAQRKISQCRDALGKKKHAVISVDEFIEYWEIPLIKNQHSY
jgi:hypothetical protein